MFLTIAISAAIIALVGLTFFVLFLRAVSDFFGNADLAKDLRRFLTGVGVVIVGVIALEVMAELVADQPGGDRGAGVAAMILQTTLVVLSMAWLALLVQKSRTTITEGIQAHNHPPA